MIWDTTLLTYFKRRHAASKSSTAESNASPPSDIVFRFSGPLNVRTQARGGAPFRSEGAQRSTESPQDPEVVRRRRFQAPGHSRALQPLGCVCAALQPLFARGRAARPPQEVHLICLYNIETIEWKSWVGSVRDPAA
eukprot:16433953-Heterocapsa_arctica.AAC.1